MRYAWVLVFSMVLALPAAALAQTPESSLEIIQSRLAGISRERQEVSCATTPISCGQAVSGNLGAGPCTLQGGAPVDYYQFAGSNGETVKGTLSSSAFKPFLELLDPHSEVITSSTAPATVEVQLVLNQDGNWIWAVTNGDGKTGAYSFNFQCPGSSGPGCIPNDATLCVANGRFKVTATFDAGQGNSGDAHTFALTGDTGYLWFFGASNVEAVIKVLNACSFSNHYWVFAGGLTNVAVVITVTDTQTGTMKTYRNPPNTVFQPIQDTSAFATCP